MKEKIFQFMAGRNGNDALNRFLLGAVLVLILLGTIFSRSAVGRLMLPVALVLMGFAYFRMFSRNRMKRAEENGRYLRLRESVLSNIRVGKEQWAQRKDYKFFVCPSCKTRLRVPKGRGKIKIVCRKCGNSFMGKS